MTNERSIPLISLANVGSLPTLFPQIRDNAALQVFRVPYEAPFLNFSVRKVATCLISG